MHWDQVRFRRARPGPELELLTSAFRMAQARMPAGKRPIILREPELPTGYPDLLAVYPRIGSRSPLVHGRKPLPSVALRILHHVYTTGGGRICELAHTVGLGTITARNVVRKLYDAAMVRLKDDFVWIPRVSDVFALRRIVAVEAKIRDWRSAIEQAVANLWYASHSYILIPRLRNIATVVQSAAAFGVGVLTFDGRSVQMLSRAHRQPLPSSYGSWLLNDWILMGLASRRLDV